MDVVIFAGGSGTRLREMTEFLPKPLIPIGGKPMIWHIMKHYMHYGHVNFTILLGYKQEKFKEYFANYQTINNDISISMGREIEDIHTQIHSKNPDLFSVTLLDTGLDTWKGGRLYQAHEYLRYNENFLVTYGDGVSNINIDALIAFHNSHNGIATITGVKVPSKFGLIEYNEKTGRVSNFAEKPHTSGKLTNGGFMVFNNDIFNYLSPECDLETDVFKRLVQKKLLYIFTHNGFWKNMDTLKDVGELEEMWKSGFAPWKIW